MPTPRQKRKLKGEGGQATFELLLILPFFIGLVLLVVDLGMLMYSHVTVSNAVREGARYAAVGCAGAEDCTADEVANKTAERSSNALTPDQVDVGWDGTTRGSAVYVKATGRYEFLFFRFGFNVISCAAMRIEQENLDAKTDGLSSCGD